MMPRLSGDQMVAEFRHSQDMSDVPIIMLTAKADDALRVRLLKLGVQDYLTKPFEVEELLARVNGLLKDRKRYTDLVSNSEARFQATFEQAAVGIALVALNGHWLRVNRKLCQIVGYSEEEMLSRSFLDITHPDDMGIAQTRLAQMLSGKMETLSTEKRYLRKDGSNVWVNITVSLVRTPDGSPDYFVSVIEDISTRKASADLLLRQSEELAQHNLELERFNRVMVGRELEMVALKDRIKELSQRLEQKDQANPDNPS